MHTANEPLAPHAGRFSIPTWATSKRSPNYGIERLEDATTLRSLSPTHASSQKTIKVETRQGNPPRKTSTPRHSRNHWRPTSLRPSALPRNWTKKNTEVDMFWVCIAVPEDLHLRRDFPNNPRSDRPGQRNERNRQHQRECLPPRMSSREPGLTQYGPVCPQSFDQQCQLGIGARKPFRPRSSGNAGCF